MPLIKVPCCVEHFSGSGKDFIPYSGPLYQVGGGFFGDLVQRYLPLVSKKVAPYMKRKLGKFAQSVGREYEGGATLKV